MNVELYIEGVRIDLYDNEGINIKLNSQDINDISKVNAGYTKDFSVPASKVNNTFFKHYYNADIIGGFDARTKKKATIYLDDLFFISGKIRLTSTSLKDNNNIVDYRIQFEGEVVNIKDLLADRKLKDLDLSQYNHIYNSDNVGAGLSSSLFNGSVIYPLISSVNRWVYDSSNSITNTETTKNIHYDSASTEQFINYNELKPALRVADIIDEIQSENNLNFVGDFFNRDYYNNLYLWFSNDAGQIVLRDESQATQLIFTSGDEYMDLATSSIDTSQFNSISNFSGLKLFPRIFVLDGFEDVSFNYVVTLDGREVHRRDNLTTGADKEIFLQNFEYKPSLGEGLLRFYIESSQLITLSEFRLDQQVVIAGLVTPTEISRTGQTIFTGNVVMKNQAPDLKQLDLITGLIKMFNIALTPQIDGSILWETLPEWYAQGKEFKDFEQYIDIDKTSIKRGNLINEFKFKYEEPQTILNIQYAKNNGNNNLDPYGDYTKELLDENDELLDGGKLDIKLPFEQVLYERLTDISNGDSVPFQYGLSVDDSLSAVVPKGLLFYNVPNQSPSLGYKKDDGSIIAISDTLNTPNQATTLDDIDSQTICFNADKSSYNYTEMPNSLYKSFYSDYVSDIFSPQRRIYTFDAVIPNFILASINLNDRLIIGNKRYLINSINSNLTTQKTKLELINDIYSAGDLIGEQFYANPTLINAVVNGGVYQSTIYNNAETVLSLVDEGDGIFASIEGATTINGVVTKNFNVQPNATGEQRVMSILCTKGTETFKIVILQEGSTTGGVTFDNTNITFDNTNITFDNQ